MAKLRRSNSPVVVARTKGDAEITPVSSETEVRIPYQNYLHLGALLMAVDLGLWSIGWLLWARSRAKTIGYWRWMTREWVPWLSIEWPWVAITVILCWIGPSAAAYAWYLAVELLAKRTPAYTPWPSEYGLWSPFRRPLPDDGDEYEKDAKPPTVNLKLWELVQGKKRMREAPDLMLDTRACQFYRALAGGAATFSEREASRYGIRPGEFKRYIREPLMHKGHAVWKDDDNHNQGVKLTPQALVSLGHLGKHRPAPPRQRA